MAKGSTPIGDKERAHKALARKVSGKHLTFKADPKDEGYTGNLALTSSLCSWIGRNPWPHTWMDLKYLQDYPNWYAYLFRASQAKGKWPPTELIIGIS